MSPPTPVYVLASGEYDDYRVHCVVAGMEQDAVRLAERINGKYRAYDRLCVEALPVVEVDVQPVVEVLNLQTVIYDDGRETENKEWVEARWSWAEEDYLASREVPAWWRWQRFPSSYRGVLHAWGTDHARVRTLFETHRQELLTDELGGLRGMRNREGAR